MAAYAALVSVMNVMDNIRNHPRLSTCLDEKQAESLVEKIDFLLDFVENYNNSHGDGGIISKEEAEDLESQIASAAHAAEDVIESHIADQVLPGSTGDHEETSSSFLFSLQKIEEEMDSIKKKVMEVKKERGLKLDHQPKSSMPAASSRPLTTGKITMVGFDSYMVQLLDWLTGQQSDRHIISITGMGGIGKTTLAKNIYENSLIVQHFDVHAWVTVSQNYDVRQILLQTLSCLRESTRGVDEISEEELGVQLHKSLSGRRYLIILDDIWSIGAWDKIKFFFPDNRTRSRIIVTTRISNMASHFGPLELALNLLEDDQSWNVFCENVFGQEGCPFELEEIGKRIVGKCRGLPLSIVVIGGLLRKSSRTQVYWLNVEKDISSILNSAEDNQCLNILSLSYSNLPLCLKPCFLYLGIFPEDHEIHVSKLIKLWVAEGFIKPNRDQTMEDIAKGYLKDLINRNLILVRKLGMTGKCKTCTVHDLLRDLCTKIAKKEKFFCIMRKLDSPRDIGREHRIVIRGSIAKYCSQVFRTLKSTLLIRSVISESWCPLLPKSRLLRVLYNTYVDSNTNIFQQVNLRFLLFYPADMSNIPSSISLLWNLQTLIVELSSRKFVAPSEIWEMPQLRHVKLRICLPDPPLSDERDGTVLRNLQTLWIILNFRCSEEACKRMPNIKKLHIFYDDFWGEGETSLSNYCLHNVSRLTKLESLYYGFKKAPNRDYLLQSITFPRSLKKLYLENCGLHWNDLSLIGLLPYLEVLILHWDAVRGAEWNPLEGEFLHLKFLGIYHCSDLIYWNADKSHFPVLEKLILSGMIELAEIPSGIGEITTLQGICVVECSIFAAISALKILEEQETFGNQDLQVQVKFQNETRQEEFRKIVEQEGFTALNFQLS